MLWSSYASKMSIMMSNIIIVNDNNMLIGSHPCVTKNKSINHGENRKKRFYFLDLTVADDIATQFADDSWGSMSVWALVSSKGLELGKASEIMQFPFSLSMVNSTIVKYRFIGLVRVWFISHAKKLQTITDIICIRSPLNIRISVTYSGMFSVLITLYFPRYRKNENKNLPGLADVIGLFCREFLKKKSYFKL